eukprot:scaffold482_cov266-Amphora_coffeaeformis.AAC.17
MPIPCAQTTIPQPGGPLPSIPCRNAVAKPVDARLGRGIFVSVAHLSGVHALKGSRQFFGFTGLSFPFLHLSSVVPRHATRGKDRGRQDGTRHGGGYREGPIIRQGPKGGRHAPTRQGDANFLFLGLPI